MKKKRVLYFFVGKSTFVTKDIQFIQSEFEVKVFNFSFGRKWKTPFQLITQIIFLIRFIRHTNIIICQLAGYHSFFPVAIGKLFSKPSLIIAAGTDCQSFPSIRYGNFQKKMLGFFTGWSFKHCMHISPKHKSLIYSEYKYDNKDFPHQGIRSFLPGIKTPFTVIPNGYDADLFHRTESKIKNQFITVSGNLQYAYQTKLKGIDLIMEIAESFPDCTFYIVGVPDPENFPKVPANIRLIPPLNNRELIKLYSESEYYLQLSMAEGFPNALCEAMLCECIPIGSNVFSIPEIIGTSGYVLNKRDPKSLQELIFQILKTDNSGKGAMARELIKVKYPLTLRRTQLLGLIDRIISGKS